MTSRLGIAATAAALTLISAAAVSAQDGGKSAASVAGTWTVSVAAQGPHGAMSAELTLEQDGRKVSGRLAAHGSEHALEGKFEDGTLTLATGDNDTRQLTLTAKLKDDGTLDGYLSGPMGDVRWTAARAKDAK
jgi:hypothetical protein